MKKTLLILCAAILILAGPARPERGGDGDEQGLVGAARLVAGHELEHAAEHEQRLRAELASGGVGSFGISSVAARTRNS